MMRVEMRSTQYYMDGGYSKPDSMLRKIGVSQGHPIFGLTLLDQPSESKKELFS